MLIELKPIYIKNKHTGNEIDAKNCDSLARKGIFYILNVTKNVPFYDCTNSNGSGLPKFITKRIAVNDCENQNLKNHFEEASEFIGIY